MAKAKAPERIAREIVDVPVDDEMRDSFMPYALSVTTSRAIPDVRDGLKPVQRRILYVMADLGLRPSTPFRKSAGVVGEVRVRGGDVVCVPLRGERRCVHVSRAVVPLHEGPLHILLPE